MPSNPRFPTLPGYELIEKIGQGGMGTVYKATKNDVEFAIKTILQENSIEALTRFEREALAAAAVDKHPNVVSIHKLELNSQPPFIVMDYVEGKSLDQLIRRAEPWTLTQLIDFLVPLVSALDHMHSKGVIHRDLKPANILVRHYDKAPLITDFGLAKLVQLESLSHTGQCFGTPNYMAPEQFEGSKTTAASDLWALAVICYELLTGGERPFQGGNQFVLAQRILNKNPKLLPEALGLPRKTQTFFRQALEKDPKNRYSCASSFLQALRQSIDPPSRKKFYVGVGLCALSVIGGVGYVHLRGEQRAQVSRAVEELSQRIRSVRERLSSETHKQHIEKLIHEDLLGLLLEEEPRPHPYLSECIQTAEKLKADLAQFRLSEKSSSVPNLFRKGTPEAQAYQVLQQIRARDTLILNLNKVEDPALEALLYVRQKDHSNALTALNRIPIELRKESFKLSYSSGLLSLTKKQFRAAYTWLSLSKELTQSKETKRLKASILEAEAFLALQRKQDPRAALCFFKLQQLDPNFNLPQKRFPKFTVKGKIDLNLLGRYCSELCLSSQTQPEFVDYLVESVKREIFLHSFTRKNLALIDLHDQSILSDSKKLLHPAKSIYHSFWFDYSQSFKESGQAKSKGGQPYNEILERLQELTIEKRLPNLYRSLVHFRLASLLRQREKISDKSQWPPEIKALFFLSLKNARELGYPAPDQISWESYRGREDELRIRGKSKSVALEILPHIQDAIAGLKDRAERTRAGRLYEGRPSGQGYLEAPLQKLDDLLFDYYGKLAKTQHCAQQVKAARATLDLAFKHSPFLRCPTNTLEILIECEDLETLLKVQSSLETQLKNSSMGSKVYSALSNELRMAKKAIRDCRERLKK